MTAELRGCLHQALHREFQTLEPVIGQDSAALSCSGHYYPSWEEPLTTSVASSQSGHDPGKDSRKRVWDRCLGQIPTVRFSSLREEGTSCGLDCIWPGLHLMTCQLKSDRKQSSFVMFCLRHTPNAWKAACEP